MIQLKSHIGDSEFLKHQTISCYRFLFFPLQMTNYMVIFVGTYLFNLKLLAIETKKVVYSALKVYQFNTHFLHYFKFASFEQLNLLCFQLKLPCFFLSRICRRCNLSKPSDIFGGCINLHRWYGIY